ncbi:MAG: phosphotransferase [Planctomycetota bacterium]
MSVERLENLSCWRGTVSLTPITGGITNRNYLVRDLDQWYVARICENKRVLGIDRVNEVACQRAAAEAGIAPPIVHHEPGILVSQFVQGKTLDPASVRETDMLKRIAATLQRLHGARDALTGELLYFSPFQTIRTYVASARRLGAPLPEDIDELVQDSVDWSRRMRPFQPTLCHNDLLAANLLADVSQLWLVDWEYAGMGHPLFDLASVAGNCQLSPGEEEFLLRAYQGFVDPIDQAEVRILKTASLLREALWGAIQIVFSDLAFDYAKYASDYFAEYRKARIELEKTATSARGAD